MLKFIARILRFAGADAGKLKLSALISFFEGLVQNVPIIVAWLIFVKITDQTLAEPDIAMAFLVILASLVLRWVLRYAFVRLQSDGAARVGGRERIRIGDLFKRFPMSYFTEGNIGNVTSVITGDLSFAEDYGMTKLEDVITGLVSLFIACAFMLWVDWRTALASVIGCVLAMLALQAVEKVTKRHAPVRQEEAARLTGAVLEYTEGISVIKALNMAGAAAKRISTAIDDNRRRAIDFEQGMLRPINRYLDCYALTIAAVLFLSFWQYFNGEMSLAVVVMVALFVFRVYAPAMGLVSGTAMMRIMEAGLDRYERLRQVPIIDADGKNKTLESFDVVFDDVTFSYGDSETLKQVSFTAKERSMTALVGASGSGKTTIANLIVRFWDAQEGSVKVGGVDVREMTCDSLLRYTSMVFQHVYLFNDTIENNIRFGSPDATHEEIVDAAQKARCHNFIEALPDGYQTMVGEGGSTLSGGEKQRVSIARAILKDAPIVLLDEATASVDPDNERHIQAAINELVRDKTLIVIAHRLSTIRRADQILVVDEGRIVERGTHDDLVALCGAYRKLWERRQKAKSWRIAHKGSV
ncbi:MAG: ABC transporter ATP-binding protein/permease [Coriobacteriales bacterium]|jgi:ATP-binding cassette subfamily B protein|nr:ABC transporter ATP-binding protein/permease [Coriobacteriales bacterium]